MKHLLLFIFLATNIAYSTDISNQWTFLIYMEGSHEIAHDLIRNINQVVCAKPTLPCTIVVQLHTGDTIAWRYQVKPGALLLQDTITITNESQTDFVNAAQWAFTTYPAHHYGIIIGSHGFGILDPHYYPVHEGFAWIIDPDGDNTDCTNNACPTEKKSVLYHEDILNQHKNHRGMMFNITNTTYLTSSAMYKTFKTISNTILSGKKLDLLGTDCCKMSMLEVCYQVQDYISYFIGAQNCELKDGWDFTSLFNSLKDQEYTPQDIATIIIDTYATYYAEHTKTHIYTQSALDLSQTSTVVDALQKVTVHLLILMDQYPKFTNLIDEARQECPGMCEAPYYIDLWTWAHNLSIVCNDIDYLTISEQTLLIQELQTLQNSITSMVIAMTAGKAVSFCNGINIYYPKNHIDPSYEPTKFARETNWLEFLQKTITNR
jgi:hypothetical protein